MGDGNEYIAVEQGRLRGINAGPSTLSINGRNVDFEAIRYAELNYEWSIDELAVGRSMTTRLWGITPQGMRVPLEQVEYESGDEAIAIVNGAGVATGLADGNITLTATATLYNNESSVVTKPLRVYEEELAVVEVRMKPHLLPGETTDVDITAYYNSGYEVDLQLTDIAYTSTHPVIAAIDGNGMVTAGQQAGISTIQAAITLGQVTSSVRRTFRSIQRTGRAHLSAMRKGQLFIIMKTYGRSRQAEAIFGTQQMSFCMYIQLWIRRTILTEYLLLLPSNQSATISALRPCPV